MTRSLRSAARWFKLGLWLVALVFAGFLIGLGGILDDLKEDQSPVTASEGRFVGAATGDGAPVVDRVA